jgi:CheY-like chemotaxis protein
MYTSAPQDWIPEDAAIDAPMVLIVDDEADLVSGLSELLESEGYRVATAMDGLEALDQLRRGLRPTVILLDLMMPRMDGWDFRQEQLKDDDLKEIPVIVLTAAGFSRTSIREQFGDIELVSKPSGHAFLLSVLRESCGEPGPL